MLDADTLQTLAEQVVGNHVDVEVDSGAGLVYVSLFGAAKLLILSADGTQPVDVAVDTTHKLIFVSCLGGNDIAPSLIVLEHPTMAVLHRVRLFSGGRAVESRSGSGLAYVAGEAGLTIVDGRAGVVATRFQLGDIHLNQGLPFSLAVDQVTGTAYVGTRDEATLFRVDAPTDAGRVFW